MDKEPTLNNINDSLDGSLADMDNKIRSCYVVSKCGKSTSEHHATEMCDTLSNSATNLSTSRETHIPDIGITYELKTIERASQSETETVTSQYKGTNSQNTNHLPSASLHIADKLESMRRRLTKIKSTGYRNKCTSIVPVNDYTAIHVPRPMRIENEHTNYQMSTIQETNTVNGKEQSPKSSIPHMKTAYGIQILPKQNELASTNRQPGLINNGNVNPQADMIFSDMKLKVKQMWTTTLTESKVKTSRGMLIKRPRLSPVHENVSDSSILKCKNNNSKALNKPVTSSVTANDASKYMQESNRSQDNPSSKTTPHTVVRDSIDMATYVSQPSTSEYVEQNATNQLNIDSNQQMNLSTEVTDTDIVMNTSLDELDHITDIIEKVASGEIVVSSSKLKKKIKKKIKSGGPAKCNTETLSKPAESIDTLDFRQTSISENNTEMAINQRNRLYNDLEARYYEGKIDGKDIYNNDNDVIRQVELNKLSAVKDHRLFTLSEEEKAFLRRKSYLNDEAVEDIKRRFGSQDLDLSQRQSHELNDEAEIDQRKVTSHSNTKSKLDHSLNRNEPNTNKQPTRPEQQVRVVLPKPQPRNVDTAAGKPGHMTSSYPVIRLQRIEKQMKLPSTSQTSTDSGRVASVANVNIHNATNPNKIYYVINKDDLNKIKTSTQTLVNANTSRVIGTSAQSGHLKQMRAYKTLVPNQTGSHQTNGHTSFESKSVNKNRTATEVKVEKNQSMETATHRSTSNQSREQMERYPNTLTVKELLELKRKSQNSSDNYVGELVQDRAADGFPIKLDKMHKNVTVITPNIKLEKSEDDTNDQPSTSRNSREVQSSTCSIIIGSHPTNEGQRSGKIIRIVDPSNLSVSDLRTTLLTQAQRQRTSGQSMYPTFNVNNDGVDDDHVDKPTHIKVGDNTMIVCNRSRPKTESGKRKTLPAPKPKNKVDNHYKRRKRRPSKDRKQEKDRHRSLNSKLKKLLAHTENSLHKLANTLDLVPIDILKEAIIEPTAEFDSVVRKKLHVTAKKSQQVAGTSANHNHDTSPSTEEYRKDRPITSKANFANIIQIFSDDSGEFAYTKRQIEIKYRLYGTPASDHTTQSEFPCRIKFDENGNILQISIEMLRQGLYLINRSNVDVEFCRNIGVLHSTLVVYPPHAAVLPPVSLAIAVGDIFPYSQRDRYKFDQHYLGDIQEELRQFLWPFTMDNVSDLMDRRYGSVTERHLSPRCSSPMFYSETMVNMFDRCGNVVSDTSSEDLTSDGTGTLRRVASSERAMALKIKQNELFESCNKLKSQQSSYVVPKKKRRRVQKQDVIAIRQGPSTEAVHERVVNEYLNMVVESDCESQNVEVE